jgi:DNA-binding FrmR family transcriptional regulator
MRDCSVPPLADVAARLIQRSSDARQRPPLCKPRLHQTHPDIVKRLKRAAGHLAGIIEMIEGGRSCLDLAQQLQAAESAITNGKRTLIHDHLDHCLESAVCAVSRDQRAPIDEFKQITKYL